MKCECGSEFSKILLTPDLTHYAKEVCVDCGKYQKWLPYPNDVKPEQDMLKWQENENDYMFYFGKHKGALLNAVINFNFDYIKWMTTQDFPDAVIDVITTRLEEKGIAY